MLENTILDSSQFGSGHRGDQERAAKIIEDALNKGVEEVLADINQYFERNIDRVEKVARNLNTLK